MSANGLSCLSEHPGIFVGEMPETRPRNRILLRQFLAAVDTAGTPLRIAPTQRPAVNRYSIPLPAGHCAEGASENVFALPGHEPKLPQLPTCI